MSGSSLGIAFVKTFSSHYPERLGAIQLIDPPGVFQVLLKAVGAVMDERTAKKLASVTGASHAERMVELKKRLGDGPHMPWLRTVLDTPAGETLPAIPDGYFAVADTTPVPQTPPAQADSSAGTPQEEQPVAPAVPAEVPAGKVLTDLPPWTAGIKQDPHAAAATVAASS